MKTTLLKVARRLYSVVGKDSSRFGRNWHMFSTKQYASDLIFSAIKSEKPLMVARLGSTEAACLTNYLGVKRHQDYKSIMGYITSQTPPWWWNKSNIEQLKNWSGFFPAEVKMVERFCEMHLQQLTDVDILGSWLKEESFFSHELAGAKKVVLEDLEPFFTPLPWTRALEGKKVLVVHPFARTILSQYGKRDILFDNGLLPEFELEVIQAVQSLAGQTTEFATWFDALDAMQNRISRRDFDVCILGCGAYGFPLASFVKNMGKQAIHLGGVTQLLFGIIGARWEQYIVYPYANLFNQHWVRPSDAERPEKSNIVEGGCYW